MINHVLDHSQVKDLFFYKASYLKILHLINLQIKILINY